MSKGKGFSHLFVVLSIALAGSAVEAAPAAQPAPAKKTIMRPVAAAKAALNPVAAAKAAKKQINDAKEKINTAKDKITKTLIPEEQPPAIRDKWALLVGLEAFNDDTLRPVKNAQTNASLLSTFFASPELGKFGQNRVVIVTNNKATKNNVTKALGDTWLLKNALPNDMIVLYFCTRASRTKDGSDLLLYMFDTPMSQPELGSIPLKETLKELRRRTQSTHILCLLDLGPSATKQTESDDAVPDAAPQADAAANQITLQEIAKETGTTILAATDIGGKSYPSGTKGCSSFVEQLLEGLATSNGQVEFDQVAQYVERMVSQRVEQDFRKKQVPILATSEEGAPMLKTMVSMAVKSSTPEKQPKIGHPPERTPQAIARAAATTEQEEKLSASKSASSPRHISKEKDDEDDENYDEANFGNVDFGPYMDKMKKDIQSKWKPPKGFNAQRVIAVFSIKKDGTIANASIVDGSGVESVDKSAMEALEAASPLDPLPAGSPPYVQIRYQFDWKVTKN